MAKAPSPSDSAARFLLRLPQELRERLSELAQSNGRSLNAEIIARLQSSFEVDSTLVDLRSRAADFEDRLNDFKRSRDEMRRRMEEIAAAVGHQGSQPPSDQDG